MNSQIRDLILLLRPKHWIKNLFLFAAPLFGGRLFHEHTLQNALPALVAFSLCASAGYVINDIRDIVNDRVHPEKKRRPIASGAVSKGTAVFVAVMLTVLSLFISYTVGLSFLLFPLAYLLIHISYSFYLKHVVILDVFCIASGFVIRVLAGGAAFDVPISQWLLLTMFMISLVLGTGKRLGEVSLLQERMGEHRRGLDVSVISTLDDILLISSGAALIAYALYTVEQSPSLVYTIPLVTLGLFRYLLVSKRGLGDPTDAMTKDALLAATVFVWLLLVSLIRYT